MHTHTRTHTHTHLHTSMSGWCSALEQPQGGTSERCRHQVQKCSNILKEVLNGQLCMQDKHLLCRLAHLLHPKEQHCSVQASPMLHACKAERVSRLQSRKSVTAATGLVGRSRGQSRRSGGQSRKSVLAATGLVGRQILPSCAWMHLSRRCPQAAKPCQSQALLTWGPPLSSRAVSTPLLLGKTLV